MSDVTGQSNCSRRKIKRQVSVPFELPAKVRAAFDTLVRADVIQEYELETIAVSSAGENSYGRVMRLMATPTRTLPTLAPVPPFRAFVKVAPQNQARRKHMRVADFYEREVFIYRNILEAYDQLTQEATQSNQTPKSIFETVPRLLYASLEPCEEFLILEDLVPEGYMVHPRSQIPTYELVRETVIALAHWHAMSLTLQAKRPQQFAAFIAQMLDNLFIETIDPLSVEFGRKYIRRTRELLNAEPHPNQAQLDSILERIEKQFKTIGIRCVNGMAIAPNAVICHGDFWNNNILYKFDKDNMLIGAKIVDFQMARYASPVLDLAHYFFTCTTKSLRDEHLKQLLQLYYDTLSQHVSCYGLDTAKLYPQQIFEQHWHDFGIFGFCMSAFAVPFVISEKIELPDLDDISQAASDLRESEAADDPANDSANVTNDNEEKLRDFVEENDLLTPRNLPIFKERMLGGAADLIKYEMVAQL